MEWMTSQVNMIGKAFVGLALPMLLQSVVLAGFVLLVDSFLRAWVRAGLRYWLVTCVLAYLVLIPLLSISPPSTHWPAGAAAYADPTPTTPASHTNAPPSQPATGQSGLARATDRPWGPSPTPKAEMGEQPYTLTWQGALFLLWLTGATAFAIVLMVRARAACRRIDDAPSANHLMNDILIYCRKRMGIPGNVRLKVGYAGMKPAVCGLFRPVIIVPRNLAPTLGSRHLRDVIFHELAHLKRHDLWVNLVQNVLHVLYFYNPLLWFVNRVIRRVREEAADEIVLETIGDPDHLYTRRLSEVETLTIKTPPPSLHLIGVA